MNKEMREIKKAERIEKKEARQAKRLENKAKRLENWNNFKELQKNPAVVIAELTALAAFVGCAAEMLKTAQKVTADIQSVNNKDTGVWDAANGMRIQTIGELSKSQLVEFDARKRNGETAIEILDSMNMIK